MRVRQDPWVLDKVGCVAHWSCPFIYSFNINVEFYVLVFAIRVLILTFGRCVLYFHFWMFACFDVSVAMESYWRSF